MNLEFRDEDIRKAARIARCRPADLKAALLRGQDEANTARKVAMIEAAVIVERRARSARLKFDHPQAHALDLAAKAIRKDADSRRDHQ